MPEPSKNWKRNCKTVLWFQNNLFLWFRLRGKSRKKFNNINYRAVKSYPTWETDLECTPRSLGPPAAMVEHVELCLEGPGSDSAPPSRSQCSTTVIRPLLSMIFQDGVWNNKHHYILAIVMRKEVGTIGMAQIPQTVARLECLDKRKLYIV